MCMSSFHLSWISIFRDLHPSWHKVENDIVRVQFSMQKKKILRKHKCVYSFVNYCLQVANICNLYFYLVVEKEFQFFIHMTITPGFYFEQKIQCFYSEAFVINSFFLHLIDLWPQIFDIIYSKIFWWYLLLWKSIWTTWSRLEVTFGAKKNLGP